MLYKRRLVNSGLQFNRILVHSIQHRFCICNQTYLYYNLHVVGNVISNKSGLKKRKFKVSTVDIQIKRSGLRVSNSKLFSSDYIVRFLRSTTLGCKDIKIIKSEFVAKTKFLYLDYLCVTVQTSVIFLLVYVI